MSIWRDIWAKAIRANARLVADRRRGEADFERLIHRFPDDGMVYYSRGESYECLGLFDLAFEDYRTAEQFMPVAHWKDVARQAADRVEQKRASLRYRSRNSLWDAFHRVYSVTLVPHQVRVVALSAIARFDSEPHSTAALLRSCLEELVLIPLRRTPADHSERKTLKDRINFFELHRVVSPEVARKMHKLRHLGNKGAHPEERMGVDFSPVVEYFTEIVESIFHGSPRR